LEQGRNVLFSGTPCQIAGLKSFLGKDYDNLLLVDIICHGVPSPLLWNEYKKYYEEVYSSNIKGITFRRKDDGWKQYCLVFTFENANEYRNKVIQDAYLKLFLKDVCLRESCYDCKYKTEKRVSDITIADFWGVQNEYPELDDDKGTSFVITHSDKGKFSIKKLVGCTVKEIPLERGVKYNPAYVRSASKPRKRNYFFKDLNVFAEGKISLDKLVKKYTVDGLCVKGYRFIRRCLGKIKRMIVK
jgi:coenzyme F420-reducing hydrogenase beta subunit